MSNPKGILTGSSGKRAAKAAANAQTAAIADAIDTQKEYYDKGIANLQPYADAGMQGSNTLNYLLGLNENNGNYANINKNIGGYGSLSKSFDNSTFEQDPGYQFRLQEGLKALDRGSSAKRSYFGGAAQKALSKYAGDQASQEYGNAYNRYTTNQNNLYNKFANLNNQGFNATNNMNTLGSNYATNAANLLTDKGAVQASGIIGANNANTAGFNTTVNLAGQIAGAAMGAPSFMPNSSGNSTWINPDLARY